MVKHYSALQFKDLQALSSEIFTKLADTMSNNTAALFCMNSRQVYLDVQVLAELHVSVKPALQMVAIQMHML